MRFQSANRNEFHDSKNSVILEKFLNSFGNFLMEFLRTRVNNRYSYFMYHKQQPVLFEKETIWI